QNTQNTLLLLGLTILSVWMIVSALLESWIDPLIVICAVPLSFIGVMAGTLYHDLPFARGAIAGTLLCVGVVVNNAILLMHEKQRYRALDIGGLRSWLYVYRNKMRAVLITTLTTVGGLIPMIWFGGSQFWSQLATVTAWGLSTSTIFLLLLMGIWEK
ncbi:MAG TPA: efflux RND transporter permease subunit, partial [Balneolaceae bacterium]|nr:efflux RND transporter permease subunit [Balneolaceae bacterium]